MLKSGAVDKSGHRPAPGRGRKAGKGSHATPQAQWERTSKGDPRKRKKTRKKSLAQRFFDEAFDVIEDIFD